MKHVWKWWHQFTYRSTWSGPSWKASVPSLHLAIYVAKSRPHCRRLSVLSLATISQVSHAFLLRLLEHWQGAATTSSSIPCEIPPSAPSMGGPQPLFWRNRDKNKLANKLRHLIDELNSSTCRLGFKPWCMSHTTRQESCTYGFRCVLGELGRFRKGTWFREPVPGSISGTGFRRLRARGFEGFGGARSIKKVPGQGSESYCVLRNYTLLFWRYIFLLWKYTGVLSNCTFIFWK